MNGRAALREVLAGPSAALLPYHMAGVPDAEGSVKVFEAMAAAGADGFEIGLPYADPLMDGPVIQEAGRRALETGMTLDDGLDVVRRVASATGKPCLVMTYVNPVLRRGAAAFANAAAAAGASGVIIPDLPVEEAAEIRQAVEAAGLGMVLFAAPTTGAARLRRVVEADPMFIYGIAEMGVTGERTSGSGRAADLVRQIRDLGQVPVVLGVGISGPGPAREAAAIADGVIVGSAIVRRVLEAASSDEGIESVIEIVGELKAAMASAGSLDP